MLAGFAGTVWLIMWACVPGVGISCKWIDEPLPQIRPVQLHTGDWVLNPGSCIRNGAAHDAIATNIEASDRKLVIEYFGCVFVDGEGHPGPEHHKVLQRRIRLSVTF